MNSAASILIAKQMFWETLRRKGLFLLFCIYIMLLVFATIDGRKTYHAQDHVLSHHQQTANESWDNNPDKHPHRMAHFGTFAFRQQHPISAFDAGLESFTGNSVFLEAHRQNTVNFSEASFSTALVRFGDLHVAMLLQLILPLIIFFIGYNAISAERENGTLKIIHTQGVSMPKIIMGKFMGILAISALFLVPALISLWNIPFLESDIQNTSITLRVVFIFLAYILFFLLVGGITVLISALSKNSTQSLLILLVSWLFMCIIIPRTAQVVGNLMFTNPSKIEFRAAVEKEVIKKGDSHDPDDPYFNNLRDSILLANNVTDVNDLPFNYSGFIMSKGEEQTSRIYDKHHKELIQTYRNQNKISNALVILNPFLAIKNISMSLSGTDFDSYVEFMTQTERYRYKQSQYLNDLQIKYISNQAASSEGKINVVDKEYWTSFPKFKFKFISVSEIIKNLFLSIISLLLWLIIVIIGMTKFTHRIKLI